MKSSVTKPATAVEQCQVKSRKKNGYQKLPSLLNYSLNNKYPSLGMRELSRKIMSKFLWPQTILFYPMKKIIKQSGYKKNSHKCLVN